MFIDESKFLYIEETQTPSQTHTQPHTHQAHPHTLPCGFCAPMARRFLLNLTFPYAEIVIFLHEHYKRINETKHNSPNHIDCSTNQNPKFWIQRLVNKNNILQQAEYRNLDVHNLWKLPNREIVSILINYDKNGS